jgi:hypothetical protein
MPSPVSNTTDLIANRAESNFINIYFDRISIRAIKHVVRLQVTIDGLFQMNSFRRKNRRETPHDTLCTFCRASRAEL